MTFPLSTTQFTLGFLGSPRSSLHDMYFTDWTITQTSYAPSYCHCQPSTCSQVHLQCSVCPEAWCLRMPNVLFYDEVTSVEVACMIRGDASCIWKEYPGQTDYSILMSCWWQWRWIGDSWILIWPIVRNRGSKLNYGYLHFYDKMAYFWVLVQNQFFWWAFFTSAGCSSQEYWASHLCNSPALYSFSISECFMLCLTKREKRGPNSTPYSI